MQTDIYISMSQSEYLNVKSCNLLNCYVIVEDCSALPSILLERESICSGFRFLFFIFVADFFCSDSIYCIASEKYFSASCALSLQPDGHVHFL